MTESASYKKPYPEGYDGINDFEFNYSPVAEAESITREAAANSLSGDSLWGYTVAAFNTALKSPEGKAEESGEHHFSVFDWDTDLFGSIQVIFDRPAKTGETDIVGYGELLGSIFLSRDTENGRDVLSYSIFNTPDGYLMDRKVGSFSEQFDDSLLSSEYIGSELYLGNSSFQSLESDIPALSNAEILSVSEFASGIASSSAGSEAGEQATGDDNSAGAVDSGASSTAALNI